MRTNPRGIGQYMSITFLPPNMFLVLADDTDVVFSPQVILNRIRANQPLNVLRANIKTIAQLRQNKASINRNYIEVSGIPNTVNRRRRRFSRN